MHQKSASEKPNLFNAPILMKKCLILVRSASVGMTDICRTQRAVHVMCIAQNFTAAELGYDGKQNRS
jgi:hypothetical protein